MFDVGSVKVKLYAARGQHFFGKASHATEEISERILFRINCPDNVAHRSDAFTGDRGNGRKRRVQPVLLPQQLTVSNFAENRDASETRANVVMQIGGNARSHSL